MGYIFIVIAAILTLAIIGQLPALYEISIGLLQILTGRLSNYQMGFIIGGLLAWILLFITTIFFWNLGIRWIKGQTK